MKYGLSEFNKNQNNTNQNFNVLNDINQIDLIKSVRIISIVLDETHPRFKELGEWNSLGSIEYEDVINPIKNDKPSIAKPLYPNIKNYPLINEIVYIISFPNTDINSLTSSNNSYYISIVSLWNHPHHNGFPSQPNNLPIPQQKDYNQIEGGNIRRINDQSSEINLGTTFKEKPNIHPLLPFEGDLIHEGRWGNSIRLGSTVNGKNNWSTNGNNGDPIIILRNGQGKQNEKGWVPIIEDINNDNSSIYLCNNQIIPINIKPKYNSYVNQPISPNKFDKNQIIISSGRILLNSNIDHLLLNSIKTINLNANEGINIDTTKSFIIQSKNTFIGSKDATEPLLLGNQTVELLSSLISNLKSFMNICSTLVSTAPGTPIPQLNLVSAEMAQILNTLSINLNNIKSKNNFTS